MQKLQTRQETKSVFEAKTPNETILSNLFPLVFELGHDEDYKRKFWKEFVMSKKENRTMNQSAYDSDYVERRDEEKREIYEYATKRLLEIEQQSCEKNAETHEFSSTFGLRKTRYNEEFALRRLLLKCEPVKI